ADRRAAGLFGAVPAHPAASGPAPLVHLAIRDLVRRRAVLQRASRGPPGAHPVGGAPGAPQQPTIQPVDGRPAEVEPVVATARLGTAATPWPAAVDDLHHVLDQP